MRTPFLPLAAAAALGACASAPPPAGAPIPEAPAARRKAALFYSDLGPESIDVSAYPAKEKAEYEIYRRTCSRCHTLARSINAPVVTRAWWDFYITGMSRRARRRGAELTKEEARAVLDFLEYDSIVRKVERPEEFKAAGAELKRRFDAALDERMEDLQKSAPNLSP